MAVYFQKISEDYFNVNGSFVVKESRTMRLFIAVIALAIAAGFIMLNGFSWIALLPAGLGIASLLATRKEKVVMEISKRGFFYGGQLVTDWTHFVSARFEDKAPQLSTNSLGISDQFSIAIRYRKNNEPTCYERKVALTNTQDKSEEEIMAAIKFYYNKSLGGR